MLKRLLESIRNKKRGRGSAEEARRRLKEDSPMANRKPLGTKPSEVSVLKLLLFAILSVFFLAYGASAQLADLDLLEENDRSIGVSLNATPDPGTDEYTENRSAILLLPISLVQGDWSFQGGAGAYWSQSLVQGKLSSYLQWRLQGGPQWKWVGLQFYTEGFWKESVDYAGFFRFGEFDLGHVLLSAGLGTLVKADAETDLSVGIERNAAAGGDTVVKGLLLGSAEFDTELFESCRALFIVQPGFDGDHDYITEAQLSYRFRKISLAGFVRLGYENSRFTRRYTGLVKVPF